MKTLSVALSVAFTLPLSVMAQSTSGSSGAGTFEPGPSAAEASTFGNTGRTPSVTGSNDRAPRAPGTTSNQTAPTGTAPTSFHGSGITADALFRQLDTNGDGQLSRDEFAKYQSVMGTMHSAPAGTRTGVGGARSESTDGSGSPKK